MVGGLPGLKLIGRATAVWPGTVQALAGGVVDGAFARFFVGVRVSNSGTAAWPTSEARITPASRAALTTSGILVEDAWSPGDLAVMDQQVSGEWVALPAVAAKASHLVFFKLEVACALEGQFKLELEFRTAGAANVKAETTMLVSHSSYNAAGRAFETKASNGSVAVRATSIAFDQDSCIRALGRVRGMALRSGIETCGPEERERLRLRLKDFLGGLDDDLCGLAADISTFCAFTADPPVPPTTPVDPGLPKPLDEYAVFSDTSSDLRDRARVTGKVGSNRYVEVGADAVVTGDVTCQANAFLRERARVEGNVTLGGTIQRQNGTVITGVLQEHAAVAAITIPTRVVAPGTAPVSVPPGGSNDLLPGAYGDLQVFAGATLKLRGGAYHFRRFVLEPDVTLDLDVSGLPIDIRVTDQLSFGDRDKFVLHGSNGPAWVQFYSNQSGEVRVGTDIPTFSGVVLAPRAPVHVYSRTKVSGMLWGSSVTVEPDSTVTRVGVPTPVAESWVGTGPTGIAILSYPTALAFGVTYKVPYAGVHGPRAFDAIPWSALVANVEAARALVLPASLVSELRMLADESVIGTLKTTVLNPLPAPPSAPPPSSAPGSVDAAVIRLAGPRGESAPLRRVLDAQSDEPNVTPISQVDVQVALAGNPITNAELDALIASGASDPEGLRVYKSGAGSGLTRGRISGLVSTFRRTDASGKTQVFVNQVMIVPDPAFPGSTAIAAEGDSGAIWVQTRTGRMLGLTHSIAVGGAVASRIADVLSQTGVRLQ